MAQVWYYVDNDVDVGPVSRAQLRLFLQSKRGGRATLVWCESFDGWKRADQVAEFAEIFVQASRTGYAAPAAPGDRRDAAPRLQQAPAPTDEERVNVAAIAAWIAGAVIAMAAVGAFKWSFAWPAGLGAIAWFTLRRCKVEPAALPMLAVLLGHTGWMVVGYIALAAVGRPPHWVIIDVVVVVALLSWFLLARSRAAAIGMLTYQILSLVVVLTQGSPRSMVGISGYDAVMGYIMHIALRIAGVGACIYAVVRLRSARSADEQADERVA
jgi:hypothetical protein